MVVGLLVWRDESICERPGFSQNVHTGHVPIKVRSIRVCLGSLCKAIHKVVDFLFAREGHSDKVNAARIKGILCTVRSSV
jgi:hypothetical protein